MPDFDPQALAAAQLFRSLMMAMSRPGSVAELGPAPAAEGPLEAASLAVLATLCDYQTPVFLSPALGLEAVAQRIRFETGAPLTQQPGEAAFAVVNAHELLALMAQFARGSHEYPDRSTTVIVQLPVGAAGTWVELQGPGLEAPLRFSQPGLGVSFWQARAEVNDSYPLGLDFIFASDRQITCCPRSARARLVELA